MAKKRYINTKFWSDGWIRKINPLDRYLFIYFLTNEHTNISGVYELPLSTIAYETGIDEKELERSMLPKLQPKVYYVNGWIFIKNFQRHQDINNSKIQKGIEVEMEKIPVNIKTEINLLSEIDDTLSIPYQYPMDRISIPYVYPTNNSNSNSNSNTLTPETGVGQPKEDKKPIGHKEVMDYFHQCVSKECGSPPTINGGKDGVAIKKALAKYTIGEVKRIIDFYLGSDKVEKFGYNLSVALSADTMNKWLYEEKRLR